LGAGAQRKYAATGGAKKIFEPRHQIVPRTRSAKGLCGSVQYSNAKVNVWMDSPASYPEPTHRKPAWDKHKKNMYAPAASIPTLPGVGSGARSAFSFFFSFRWFSFCPSFPASLHISLFYAGTSFFCRRVDCRACVPCLFFHPLGLSLRVDCVPCPAATAVRLRPGTYVVLKLIFF
jgi:hypothetical protein